MRKVDLRPEDATNDLLPVELAHPPPGLRAFQFSIGEDDYALFELPVRQPPARWSLPKVEAEVLRLLLEGLSNVEIARERERSPRTVANQVARLFRRLGVRSRLELFARAAEPCGGAL
jgi:DNA-binding NarL/FixJ family response regulator